MATTSSVDHDVPTDPDELDAKRKAQKDAAVVSAKAAVEKAKAHLEGAKDALAEATAERKELG